MILEINTETLEKFGITADDFLYLYLLYSECYDLIEKLELKPNTNSLQTKGLIKLGEETQDHIIRQKFLDLFQTSFDQLWSELLSHFPIRVYNNGNTRVLRAKDAHAKANNKAKEKYKKILNGSKMLHDRIIKNLQSELVIRKSSDSLGWMQMLPTWINNYTWEKYEDIEHEGSPEEKRRITRKL
tara:strand:+ start:603 stop:1157 length:555 start_codon:yes stop_codon:yes gene_type:complete